MEIMPAGNRILVKPLPPGEWPGQARKEDKLIVVPGDEDIESAYDFGVIRHIAEDACGLRIGQHVIYPYSAHRPLLEGYVLLGAGEILGTYTE